MSLDFKSTKGIFQQIADNLCHQILEGKLIQGERILSVRDLAGEYEVNRNTLLRTYSILEKAGIIVNKRGIGFFVSDDAIELIWKTEKDNFFKSELPEFIQKVKVLKLTNNDLIDLLTILKENENHENQ